MMLDANAVAAVRDGSWSLPRMFWTCLATVCSLIASDEAIFAVALAGGDEPHYLHLPRREPVSILRRSPEPGSGTGDVLGDPRRVPPDAGEHVGGDGVLERKPTK